MWRRVLSQILYPIHIFGVCDLKDIGIKRINQMCYIRTLGYDHRVKYHLLLKSFILGYKVMCM